MSSESWQQVETMDGSCVHRLIPCLACDKRGRNVDYGGLLVEKCLDF